MIDKENEKAVTTYLVDSILDFIITPDNHMGLFHIIEERIRIGGNKTKETAKETLRYLLTGYMERNSVARAVSGFIENEDKK